MEQPPPTETPQPRRRAPLLIGGGLAALVAGGAIAWVLVAGGKDASTPPPASEAGLVIDSSGAEDGRIDPAKPLRCFVQGQFVGELSLSDCARRNGVATDALDVGLDETGALAAAEQAGQTLVPLPPVQEMAAAAEETPVAAPEIAEAPPLTAGAACWKHGGGRWRRLPGDPDLNACVQTLYAGRCEKPGGATYGRFGDRTLRLVTGRVEVSDDNKSFRFLGAQAPDCSIPPVG